LTFNISEDFGVTILHRNFEMEDNEILVETFSDDKTISLQPPFTVKGFLTNGQLLYRQFRIRPSFSRLHEVSSSPFDKHYHGRSTYECELGEHMSAMKNATALTGSGQGRGGTSKRA